MLSRSTKPAENPTSQPIPTTTGRTGWDVLFSSRYLVVTVLIGLLIVVLLCIPNTSIATSEIISEYGAYLVPFVLGLVFGYWVYYHFIWDYVIFQIEDKVHNIQTEYHVSRIVCRQLRIKSGGPVNPTTTGDGHELWRLKIYEKNTNEIAFGDCHDPNMNYGVVMVYREKYDALIQHDKEMTVQAVSLQKLPHILGLRFSKTVVKDILDSLGLPNIYTMEDFLKTDSENDVKKDVKVKEDKIDVDNIADPEIS